MADRATARTTDASPFETLEHGAPEPRGQALFDMANLRPGRTGLPFVVFISQKGGASHDVRVKIARGAKVRPVEMVTVALRPKVRVVRGKLDPAGLALLNRWFELNREVLAGYRNGDIEYTEDAIAALQPIDPASI